MKTVPFFLVNRSRRYQGEERRRKPRIYYPIPIKIRSTQSCGERFEFDTVADDLSAGGFSARTPRECQLGQKLLFVIQFSLAQNRTNQAATVVGHGVVSRTRKRYDGTYDFAVAFSHYRFV